MLGITTTKYHCSKLDDTPDRLESSIAIAGKLELALNLWVLRAQVAIDRLGHGLEITISIGLETKTFCLKASFILGDTFGQAEMEQPQCSRQGTILVVNEQRLVGGVRDNTIEFLHQTRG